MAKFLVPQLGFFNLGNETTLIHGVFFDGRPHLKIIIGTDNLNELNLLLVKNNTLLTNKVNKFMIIELTNNYEISIINQKNIF